MRAAGQQRQAMPGGDRGQRSAQRAQLVAGRGERAVRAGDELEHRGDDFALDVVAERGLGLGEKSRGHCHHAVERRGIDEEQLLLQADREELGVAARRPSRRSR